MKRGSYSWWRECHAGCKHQKLSSEHSTHIDVRRLLILVKIGHAWSREVNKNTQLLPKPRSPPFVISPWTFRAIEDGRRASFPLELQSSVALAAPSARTKNTPRTRWPARGCETHIRYLRQHNNINSRSQSQITFQLFSLSLICHSYRGQWRNWVAKVS